MNTPSFVTLHRCYGEKILISPCFSDDQLASTFLHELLDDLSYFLTFYPAVEGYRYFNDDFVLTIEPEEACLELYFDTKDCSGHELLEVCFDAAIDFIELDISTK